MHFKLQRCLTHIAYLPEWLTSSTVLDEADLSRTLTEALTAHHNAILADEALMVCAHAALAATRAILPWVSVGQVRHGLAEAMWLSKPKRCSAALESSTSWFA